MSVTVPVEPGVAKPGDLIFFQKTYRTNGASHVGIYVGNGMMIHCGDPISYTSINMIKEKTERNREILKIDKALETGKIERTGRTHSL